jgi:release factor glutamine methyltransferase
MLDSVPTLPQTVGTASLAARSALAAHSVPEPSLEASVLLGHVLDRPRAWLLAHPDCTLSRADSTRFQALVERRCRREPSAYITGEKHWLDLVLNVNRNVLIPRPETELLAAEAIACTAELAAAKRAPVVVADIGTGRGALAIAVARSCPDARVYATDVSHGALRLARANAARWHVAGIRFLRGNLLQALPEPPDIVVANLPYVPSGELAGLEPELAFEPVGALDGGPVGLHVVRALLAQARGLLCQGAALLLECGAGQAGAISSAIATNWPGSRVRVSRDYAGIERVVIAMVVR